MDNNKPLQVKVDISGNHKKWFNEIQEKHSFPSYAEVIRYMILTTWQQDLHESTQMFELDPQLITLIKRYITRPDIQDRYHVFSVQDFIKKATSTMLNEIKSSKKTILDWEVKSKLNEEEKEIALAFGECMNENKTKEVVASQIANKLGKRNIKNIEIILDNYVHQHLLSREIFDGIKTYFIAD